MKDNTRSKYRWYMLALLAITGTLVTAMPFSCMPVLFPEIADELGLNLVELGTIWGMGNLAGIFVSLIGGIVGDRFSSKWILTISCILVGVTGALRGFSNSFLFLAVTMFANGIIRLIIPITITRTVGLWFKGSHNFGMAMGASAMGMGLGLSLGPLLSATYLSPWLGGWRNVLFLMGGLSAFIGILWLIFGREPPVDDSHEETEHVPIKETISKLIRIKGLWFIGLTFMTRMGSMMGMTGYMAIYLRNEGWEAAAADGTLAAFYAISTLLVVPITTLSDKIGSRKLILLLGIITNTISLGLLPLVDGWVVWALMLMSGIFMDGFMAINTTILLETKGIGSRYSGTALGMIFTIGHIGSVSSPPLGNSFESIHSGLPFTFWAVLSAIGLFTLSMVKETGWRKRMFGSRLPTPD
ncbi:MAG: MFS transporter [Dehalococcoidales bacterium]|nr:MAG: MFS transporter [Dehalococcoidales bacterium]